MEAAGASDNNQLSAPALLAAVGALATGVGSLAATGLLGQIERDHATGFSIALGLTVGGTFLAALATSGLLGGTDQDTALAAASSSRPSPWKRFRTWWHRRGVQVVRALGALAIFAGVLLAVLVAVRTASDTAKPIVDVAVTPVQSPVTATAATRTYLIDAETKATNLPSNARVTILVDGLHFDTASSTYAPTNLFQGKYGPNSDGELDIHSKVEITRGKTADGTDFNAVGIQARVAFAEQSAESNPCGNYAKQVSTPAPDQAKARAQLDPGCVVIRLPARVTPEEAPPAGTTTGPSDGR